MKAASSQTTRSGLPSVMKLRPRQEAALSALMALAAVGAALVSQHRFDMQPCPWCVLQRLIFVVVAGVALIEWALGAFAGAPVASVSNPAHHDVATGSTPVALRSLSFLRMLLATCGLAAALWQHFVASSSASCNLTLADRLLAWTGLDGWLPDIFQPRASCLDAKAWILGIPYELWSAALFVILALLALRTLLGRSPFTGSSKA